jgi:hypothetical protein
MAKGRKRIRTTNRRARGKPSLGRQIGFVYYKFGPSWADRKASPAEIMDDIKYLVSVPRAFGASLGAAMNITIWPPLSSDMANAGRFKK